MQVVCGESGVTEIEISESNIHAHFSLPAGPGPFDSGSETIHPSGTLHPVHPTSTGFLNLNLEKHCVSMKTKNKDSTYSQQTCQCALATLVCNIISSLRTIEAFFIHFSERNVQESYNLLIFGSGRLCVLFYLHQQTLHV